MGAAQKQLKKNMVQKTHSFTPVQCGKMCVTKIQQENSSQKK